MSENQRPTIRSSSRWGRILGGAFFLGGLLLLGAAFAQTGETASEALPPPVAVPIAETPDCRTSVVLTTCPESERTMPESSADEKVDAQKEQMRQQFRDADEAERAQAEFEKTHPGAILVRGQTGPDAPKPAVETFGDEVQGATRPDCMHAHEDEGLLALFFIAKDLLTDSGCK
jgi:hypothetical protein